MDYKQTNQNARKALKQVRMEIAGEYGMDYRDAFEIIENATSNGVLCHHFKRLENKKNLGQSISSPSNKKM